MSNQQVLIDIDQSVHRNVKIVYEQFVGDQWVQFEKLIDQKTQKLSLNGKLKLF